MLDCPCAWCSSPDVALHRSVYLKHEMILSRTLKQDTAGVKLECNSLRHQRAWQLCAASVYGDHSFLHPECIKIEACCEGGDVFGVCAMQCTGMSSFIIFLNDCIYTICDTSIGFCSLGLPDTDHVSTVRMPLSHLDQTFKNGVYILLHVELLMQTIHDFM